MLRKIILRMLSMREIPWYIFIGGIKLCTLLLLACFVSLLRWGGDMFGGIYFFRLAAALNETAQSVLLISVMFSVIAEDISS